MFIDTVAIKVKAGNGGNGCVSFHREKYVAAGGPDGGDGGKGGNVVLVCSDKISTLMDLRYKKKYYAQNGEDGRSAKCTGKSGEDERILLPCGTIVKDANSGNILCDLVEEGQEFVVAKGGNGGWGNVHFATPTRQIPKFAKPGIAGEEKDISLELKLIADVGLVGFPNVGKSTLLKSVTKANPKIANYHFTTLEPNLGVVSLGDGMSFVIADIPGLIEGAHEGIGLGHEFLKHIERTRLLIHVVDVSGIEGRNALEDFEIINNELNKYNEKLISRTQIIAANKTDLGTYDGEFGKEMEKRGFKVFEISAATGKGVKELMQYAYTMLQEIPKTPLCEIVDTVIAEQQTVEDFVIEKIGNTFSITGPYVERLVKSTNFDDYESLQFFQTSLIKKGIIQKLREMGCVEGDTIKMYELEFDFID